MSSQSMACSTDMETHTVDTTLDTNNNTQDPITDMQLQLWIIQHTDHQLMVPTHLNTEVTEVHNTDGELRAPT